MNFDLAKLEERGPARDMRRMLNKMRDAVQGARIANGSGYRVNRTALGQQLGIASRRAFSSRFEVQRFFIDTVQSEYLTCHKASSAGVRVGDAINVMKPRATWITDRYAFPIGANVVIGEDAVTEVDSQTRDIAISFKVTIDGQSVFKSAVLTQYIYPAYATDGFIYGITPIIGGTVTVNSESLKWIDLNVDGRMWMPKEQAVEVCVDGESQFMLMPGSAPTTD